LIKPTLDTTPAALRKFGIMMAVVLGVISCLTAWKAYWTATYILWFIGGINFLIPALLFPTGLKPVYIAWMKFAFALGWLNSKIILSLIFYLLFTPISLVQKIIGRDALARTFPNPDKTTYWNNRSDQKKNRKHFERQF
jgi:hypothetical protein